MAVGPGLCGLAVCNGLYQLSNGVEQTKMNFAMGSLGWSPQDLSYFGSFQGLLGAFAQSTIVMRFLKHFGSAGSFRVLLLRGGARADLAEWPAVPQSESREGSGFPAGARDLDGRV
jgi:hypothetical protein